MEQELTHRQLRANGVELHLACMGEGPLVVLCHGYPGLWYSWRRQLPALAAAGYCAVALDMRGYGRSSRPRESDAYAFDSLVGDVLAVLDNFSADQAVVVGHDFGANLAWHMAVHHPHRLRGVVSLCVPYDMPLSGGSDVLPTSLFADIAANHFFHMHYYQQVGVAEKSTLGREREFLAKLFWALSADGDLLDWENFPSQGTAYIDVLAEPPSPPPWSWLSAEDFEYYLAEYLCAGPDLAFIGGINSYRAIDRNWTLYRDSAHAPVEIPALFIGGQEDPVVKLGSPTEYEHMRERVADLRGMDLLPGAGHFVQQEAASAVNERLLAFLDDLD
jgi:pimeloyl-ACP methyl ester carboxylesterase